MLGNVSFPYKHFYLFTLSVPLTEENGNEQEMKILLLFEEKC